MPNTVLLHLVFVIIFFFHYSTRLWTTFPTRNLLGVEGRLWRGPQGKSGAAAVFSSDYEREASVTVKWVTWNMKHRLQTRTGLT